MVEIYQTWSREIGKREKTVDLAAEVSKAALAGGDFLCEQAMNLFISAYGAEAGNWPWRSAYGVFWQEE
jgi:glucokinase